MNTLEFLKMVWPANGIYLVLMPISGTDRVTGQEWKSYKHFAFDTIEAAADRATALAYNPSGSVDVFFALGTVKEDLTHLSKVQREAVGKKVRGKHRISGHDTTDTIKSFWLDLDVKADPKAYATVGDAATALRSFCKAMLLPKPTVTSSGGGLHAYWPLTAPVDAERWQRYASILKQLTVSWGLRTDPSRTADRASVLRPVGTFNWKTGVAREVKVVMLGSVVDTESFLSRLALLADSIDLPPVKVHPGVMQIAGTPLQIAGTPLAATVDTAAMNAAAAAGAGYEKSDPRKVVAKCLQLAWQAGHQALVPEPLWYAMIGCLRHAKDGAKAVHFMSRLSPTYDPVMTALKIQQHEEGGYPPTTCMRFESENPGGCTGCAFRGKIKTPLQLVRELVQVAPPVLQLATVNGVQHVALPPPPRPFKRVTNPMTGNARIAMTIGGDDSGVDEDVVIYDNDLYPVHLVYDERANKRVAVMRSFLPRDGWSETEVPLGRLYDKRNLAVMLGDVGVLPDLGHVEDLVQYMIAYIRDLQKAMVSTTIYAQLGWRPELECFVLPDRVVTATACEPANVSKNVNRALDWMPAKGTLEAWKAVMATYERPGMEAHQFGFGVGFASPLFIHTDYNGMVVSLVGKAGTGKTSAALSANSIWGHPKMGWADAEHDTLRAFYNKLGVLNNLPATYDEHTNLDGEIVSDLCYMVSKGRGRQRLSQDGQAAESHNNWQLMMLMTGNASLNGRLASVKADSSAESARVFEYTVPQFTLTKAQADVNWGVGGALFSNYGLAGEVYARQMVLSKDWSKERVKYWVQEVDRLASVTSGERFWSAGVACVLTGFELANSCGLTNCDIDRLLAFSVATIQGMRVVVQENIRNPAHMIADYINSNLRSVLIVDAASSANSPDRVLHGPSDKLKARLERHTNTLYIDRADFKRFCARAKIDSNNVMQELNSMGVLKGSNYRLVLGRGTIWRMAQSICWVIDLNHASMQGLGDLRAVQTAVSGPEREAVP